MILSKFALPLLIFVFGSIAGIGVQQKVLNEKVRFPEPVPCPPCNCPEAVSIQPFDVQKMKNLKEFSYSPQFSGSVSVAGVDSATVRKYIEQSIMRAFEKHVTEIEGSKRRRK
jgi:hypothetical protein